MEIMYQNICKEYPAGNDFMEAVRTKRHQVFYLLSRLIIQSCGHYHTLSRQQGQEAADTVLSGTLLAFHRQVKEKKAGIVIGSGRISVNRDNQDLLTYLSAMYRLGWEVSPFHGRYNTDRETERKLIRGQGFSSLLGFRGMIEHSLRLLGCHDPQDREELFDESLLVFWKKLSSGEIGICSSGQTDDMEGCRVFHSKLLLCSKLSTFLTGIARNLFLNRTRTAGFQNNQQTVSDTAMPEQDAGITGEIESPAFMLYLYYRIYVDDRGLRALISILQYDCSLEDKEVRYLLGIRNARIHSCRLRAGFAEWYEKNIRLVPEWLDRAQEYLDARQQKTSFLNRKISMIDQYRRYSLPYLDLSCFREEFRSIPEFRQFHLVFLSLFYCVTTGKASSLAGLPDEAAMREQMQSYKETLFEHPAWQSLLFLLFYGSDEPSEVILRLLNSLVREPEVHPGDGQAAGSPGHDYQWIPDDSVRLSDSLYTINKAIFDNLRVKASFSNTTGL